MIFRLEVSEGKMHTLNRWDGK